MEAAELICWSEFEFLKIHHRNVSELSGALARFLDLSLKDINDITYAGNHHDVGKLLISQKILNKPGKLTHEEFQIMKKHPIFSFVILKENNISKEICDLVKYHHENYDGTGYFGLKGNDIPLGARIIKVCDVYDALVSERPYRRALTMKDAFTIMDHSSNEFDPEIYKAFKRTKTSQFIKHIIS